jgi:hypothetical protein
MASVSFIEGSNGRNGLKASGTAAQANATTDSRPATIGLDSLQATEISPASMCGALAEYPCEALCGLQVPENVSAGFALCTTATRHVNVTRGTDIHSARTVTADSSFWKVRATLSFSDWGGRWCVVDGGGVRGCAGGSAWWWRRHRRVR